MLLLLLACADPPEDPAGADSGDPAEADTAAEEAPYEPVFAFALLADPHVTSEGDNLARLEAAVAWLDANAGPRGITLALVVGDIAWADGFSLAHGALDALPFPWVPVLGDNEIQYGNEDDFEAAWADQYTTLAGQLDNWKRTGVTVDNPVDGVTSRFQNATFDHHGVHFVVTDWNSRIVGTIEGEMADLHDFDGGTLPWLEDDLAALGEGPRDRVVFASHHPMHMSPGAFNVAEADELDALLEIYEEAIYASFAGHYHVNADEQDAGRPIEVYITDATWDDTIAVRVVQVDGNGAAFRYTHELIEVPWSNE